MEKRLEIFSLGGLTLHYEGQVVTGLASRKMEALMAYLAYTGRLHSREHLADLFWTDSPIESSLGNLRVMLSRLRKSFPEHLITTRQTVGLTDGLSWSDAGELSQRLGEALSQWRSSSRLLPAAVGRLEEAIGLYKGKFLEGLALREADAFDDWVSKERERLNSLVLEASFALAELYQRQNSHEQAFRLLQNVIRLDPLEERAYRSLMQLAWEQGERERALESYEQLKAVLELEMGTEPGQETRALFKRISSSEAVRQAQKTMPLRLPQDSSIFVGRQRELAEITSRLRDEQCRLLTILGLGGVGKTRLSVAAARILATDADSFPDGIYFVPLEDVSANLIISSIGAVIGKGGFILESFAQLSNFLAEKKLLLILDNFEHLQDEAEILAKLLEAAPKLKILVTSRERLQLREEWLYDVHGLDCPESDNQTALEASEAVQMFHSASNQIGLRLALGRDGKEIANLCRLVDGMPLALEMAASLARDFSLEELLERMEASMDTLRSNLRNIPQRQISVRMLFDSLWERLSQTEKAVLLRLAVFTGHISQEAAAAIAGAKPRDLEALQSRLLLREAEIGRYSLHPLIRQYAYEKLEAEPQTLFDSQTNHAQYFSHFLSSRAEIINSPEFRPACDAVEMEMDNIRSAWGFLARTGGAARLMAMLHPLAKYHMFMDRNEQGEQLFASVEGENLPRALAGWLFAYRAYFRQNLRHYEAAVPHLEEAEALLRAAHDREGLCLLLLRKIFHLFSAEKKSLEALDVLKEAETIANELNHQEYQVNVLYMYSCIYSGLGRFNDADVTTREALAQKISNPRLYADCLWIRGMNCFRREQMEAALLEFDKVLAFDSACQFETHYAHTLIIYGTCQMALERFSDAEQSFRQASAFYQEVRNFGALAVCDERLGELCLRTRREEEGLRFYQKNWEWGEKNAIWEGVIHTLANLAATFESMKWKHPMAREAYQRGVAIAERQNIAHAKAHSLWVGGRVELLFEDYPAALKCLRESIAIYGQLQSYQGLRMAAQGLFRYALRMELIELAAWLKVAFHADPNTDDEILAEIAKASDLPQIEFEKSPSWSEIDQVIEELLAKA